MNDRYVSADVAKPGNPLIAEAKQVQDWASLFFFVLFVFYAILSNLIYFF
jgi:hypothetical protein